MQKTNEWHLTKGFNIGLMIAIASTIAGSGVVWTNTVRDIQDNTECNKVVRVDLVAIREDVKIIREGLIAEGIIKVK